MLWTCAHNMKRIHFVSEMLDGRAKIAVMGAGVVGLTTATLLQERLPNAQITLVAEKFLTETTSDGAAGLFRPSRSFMGTNIEITQKWLKDSFTFYDNFLKNNSAEEAQMAGIRRIKVYLISTESQDLVKIAYLQEILSDYQQLTQNEIHDLFGKAHYKYGTSFTTLLVECRKWLPYLTKRFQEKGGEIMKKRIGSFEEFQNSHELVFNCTGLGSLELCGDTRLVPIRGQVFKVSAPWIQEAVYLDSDTYIIPGTDGVVTLGSTRQYESSNLKVDKHDAAGIWERCTGILPSLKKSKIERQWVGLRPYRPEVRVEDEVMIFPNGKSLKVIHNYGHGGYGVLSAPGTAMNAISLGLQALDESKASKL